MFHQSNKGRKQDPRNSSPNLKSESFSGHWILFRRGQKKSGLTDFAVFVLFRASMSLNVLIENTWGRQNAKASIRLENND